MAGGPTTPAMAIAASRAGSLGILAAGYKTASAIDEQIKQVRAEAIPFGVNVFAPNPLPIDPAEYHRYAGQIQTDAQRFGVTLAPRSDRGHRHLRRKDHTAARRSRPTGQLHLRHPATTDHRRAPTRGHRHRADRHHRRRSDHRTRRRGGHAGRPSPHRRRTLGNPDPCHTVAPHPDCRSGRSNHPLHRGARHRRRRPRHPGSRRRGDVGGCGRHDGRHGAAACHRKRRLSHPPGRADRPKPGRKR